MIDYDKLDRFQALMEKLGGIFTPLDAERVNIYYEKFRNVHIKVLEQAVGLLLDKHPFTRFPLPAEIWKAIVAVKKSDNAIRYAREAREQLGVCPKCRGEGVYTDKDVNIPEMGPDYFCDVARFCTCRAGVRRLENAARVYQLKGREAERPTLDYKDQEPADDSVL